MDLFHLSPAEARALANAAPFNDRPIRLPLLDLAAGLAWHDDEAVIDAADDLFMELVLRRGMGWDAP